MIVNIQFGFFFISFFCAWLLPVLGGSYWHLSFQTNFQHVFTQVRIALLKIGRFKKAFENHVGSMKVPKLNSHISS